MPSTWFENLLHIFYMGELPWNQVRGFAVFQIAPGLRNINHSLCSVIPLSPKSVQPRCIIWLSVCVRACVRVCVTASRESVWPHKKLELVDAWSTWTLLPPLCRCWCNPCCSHYHRPSTPATRWVFTFSAQAVIFYLVMPPCVVLGSDWLMTFSNMFSDLLQYFFPHRHCRHQNVGFWLAAINSSQSEASILVST